MPIRPPLHRGPGHTTVELRRHEFDSHRGSSRQRGYTTAWQKARAAHLVQHPLCVLCEQAGVLTPATVVDHIEVHRGDHQLFWNPDNWQSLCKRHHDSTKQRQERSNPQGEGWSKVHDPHPGTGALGKLLRPRNSIGGSNE